MLDAIFLPDSEYRYYAFDSQWNDGEMMTAIHNGGGDDAYLLFSDEGCIIKVFDHEASARNDPWEGKLEEAKSLVPAEYQAFFEEPAFELEYISDVIWRDSAKKKWWAVLPVDNAPETSFLMENLVSAHPAEEYADWAKDYYEMPVAIGAVKDIVDLKPLTQELVNQLNEVKLADLAEDIEEIGYPH